MLMNTCSRFSAICILIVIRWHWSLYNYMTFSRIKNATLFSVLRVGLFSCDWGLLLTIFLFFSSGILMEGIKIPTNVMNFPAPSNHEHFGSVNVASVPVDSVQSCSVIHDEQIKKYIFRQINLLIWMNYNLIYPSNTMPRKSINL